MEASHISSSAQATQIHIFGKILMSFRLVLECFIRTWVYLKCRTWFEVWSLKYLFKILEIHGIVVVVVVGGGGNNEIKMKFKFYRCVRLRWQFSRMRCCKGLCTNCGSNSLSRENPIQTDFERCWFVVFKQSIKLQIASNEWKWLRYSMWFVVKMLLLTWQMAHSMRVYVCRIERQTYEREKFKT